MILCKTNYNTMELKEIMEQLEEVEVFGPTHKKLAGLAYDSRLVDRDYLFAAIPGSQLDGTTFVQEAIHKGASVIVAEELLPVPPDVTLLHVKNARKTLAQIAAIIHKHPSRKLEVIGVTGTNGKTTVTHMIHHLLQSRGKACGLLGTVAYHIGSRQVPADRTTPESTQLQYMLEKMVEADCSSVAMEVSSHALEQHRVAGVEFDVAVFTNLTQDHLDYHGDMSSYFSSKRTLFTEDYLVRPGGVAVINFDDEYGRLLAGDCKHEVVGYGVDADATVRAENIIYSLEGTSFTLVSPWGTVSVDTPLIGAFNVSNVLAAVATCGVCGMDIQYIADALKDIPAPPGRLERVPCRDAHVFVDYAHTPDALEQVLSTIRSLSEAHLRVVFGCGGNRDVAKRSLMAQAVAKYADHIIVTSDNPRKENPMKIINDVWRGLPSNSSHEVNPNREDAIASAIRDLPAGGILVIAGKGHEKYQEVMGAIRPFDDYRVAEDYIARYEK